MKTKNAPGRGKGASASGHLRRSQPLPRQILLLFLLLPAGSLVYACPPIKLTELPKVVVFSDPLSADEHAQLGAIYEKEGQYGRAVKEYRAALKQDPKNLAALTGLGNIALAQGQPRLAIRYYQQALKVAPDNVVVLNNLAMACLLAGDPKKALHYADQAVAKAGDDPRVLDTRGRARLALDDKAGALADFTAAAEICRKNCAPPDPSACDPLLRQVCAEIEKKCRELTSGE